MATRIHPFDVDCLPLNLTKQNGKTWKHIEVECKSKIYHLLNAYVPAHLIDSTLLDKQQAVGSYRADVIPGKSKKKHSVRDSDDEDDDAAAQSGGVTFNRIALKSGFGLFPFMDSAGRPLLGLHQRLGDPVGSSCGIDQLTSWVLFTSDTIDSLAAFLSHLVEDSERAREGTFPCFGWHVRYQYWTKEAVCRARPLSSVILPAKTKDNLLEDVSRFLSPDTADFYNLHGIPYRRSYLFYGLPGTGKTSLVQALAGHCKRSVCFLQPTHPDMTDDSLRQAIITAPEDTVVVLEDVDSLFCKDRASKVQKSSLTFSGLLNALDGVGSPKGQMFVLTTNLREELDPALIRKGRVDVHVQFSHATDEQVQGMWTSFYPDSTQLAGEFCTALGKALGGRRIVTATLQHYFVQQMRSSAQEALANVCCILEDIESQEEEAKGSVKEAAADRATKQSRAGSKKNRGGKQVHVHVHAGSPSSSEGSDSDSDSDA